MLANMLTILNDFGEPNLCVIYGPIMDHLVALVGICFVYRNHQFVNDYLHLT